MSEDRDEEDVIWMSEDPTDDLPAPLVASLLAYVLHPSNDEASSRLNLIFDVLNMEGEDDSDAAIDRAIAVVAAYAAKETDPANQIGDRLRQYLVEESDEDRLAVHWEALLDLAGTLNDLLDDSEKLLGHLLLEHKVDYASVLSRSLDEMTAVHSHCHRAGE